MNPWVRTWRRQLISGKDIFAATSKVTPREIAAGLEEIMGEKVKLKETSMEEFEKSKETMFPALWGTMKVCVCHPFQKCRWRNRVVVLPLSRKARCQGDVGDSSQGKRYEGLYYGKGGQVYPLASNCSMKPLFHWHGFEIRSLEIFLTWLWNHALDTLNTRCLDFIPLRVICICKLLKARQCPEQWKPRLFTQRWPWSRASSWALTRSSTMGALAPLCFVSTKLLVTAFNSGPRFRCSLLATDNDLQPQWFAERLGSHR